MDISKTASDIKDYLVKLAINDKLPSDMTCLSTDAIEKILNKNLKPTKKELKSSRLKQASMLFNGDAEKTVEQMVRLIEKNEDQDELVDYIDGVEIVEAMESTFTCKQFLELIGS